MNSNVKTAVLWIVLICVVVLIWVVVKAGKGGAEAQPTFTEFMNQVEQGKVKGVQISGNQVKGQYTDGSRAGHHDPDELPRPLQNASREECQYGHPRGKLRQLGFHPDQRDSVRSAAGLLDLHDAADAERREQGAELRQEPRAAALHRSRRR